MAQDGPEMAKESSKTTQNTVNTCPSQPRAGPREASIFQDSPRQVQDSPRKAQERPKTAQDRPKRDQSGESIPRQAQDSPRKAQERPKITQDNPSGPEISPGQSQHRA